MKCISLWQPWASLVALGKKTIETRHWPTNHRGMLAIHAAKRFGPEEKELCMEEEFFEAMSDAWCNARSAFDLPLGAILCIVDLQECFRFSEAYVCPKSERSFGDFTPGRYGWQMRLVHKFENPIPFKGHQGLFDVPDSVVAVCA